MTPLLLRLSQWPTLDTEEKTQRAQTFYRVTWVTLLVIAAFMGALSVAQPETLPRRLVNVVFLLSAGFALLIVNRRGRTKLASWLLVVTLGGIVSGRAYSAGGISAPAIALFFYVSMVAGVLLGTRGGAVSAVALAAIGLALVFAERANLVPVSEVALTPLAIWLFSCMTLALTVVLHRQIELALSSSLQRAQAEIVARRQAEQRLQ